MQPEWLRIGGGETSQESGGASSASSSSSSSPALVTFVRFAPFPAGSKHRTRGPVGPHSADAPQLFDDTSSAYGPQHAGQPTGPGIDMGFNQIFADPVANIAMAYGTTVASQGKDIVHKEVSGGEAG